MPTDNASRGGRVKLRVDPRSVSILRGDFETMRDGLRMDLAEHPERVLDSARNRRVADELDRLLKQLRYGFTITGDPDVLRAVLGDLVRSNDEANRYAEVIAEHHAFAHLLDQIDGEQADHGE